MLTAHHISKSYNIQTILKDISFNINSGDRIGLVGPNGCGKTTLLRILTGLEEPDEGVVTFTSPDLDVGYLEQGFNHDPTLSIEETLETITGNKLRVETEFENLAIALATEPASKGLQIAYDAALQNLNQSTGSDTGQSTKILTALGLSSLPRTTIVKELSGGQKTRLGLALVLLHDPKLLLLDEPTNHLDILMLEWLENLIVTYKGGVLIVSHDRTFLDRTVNRILYLNPETHNVKEYTGNYSDFIDQYQCEIQKQESAYRDKTTFLRTIAGKLKPLHGHIKIGHSVVLGYLSQEQELLQPELTPLETIQGLAPLNETDIRSYLHYYLFSGDDALRVNRTLSFGERARLALAALVVQGCDFLLLDEPINHLDIPSRSRFEQALSQYHGTVLAVIHDRYFIQQFATELWIMNYQGVHRKTLIDF